MRIRAARPSDATAIWKILEPVVRAGDAYALPQDMERDELLAYWMAPDHEVFVAEEAGTMIGTYFVRANQRGPGAHVANCGYVTAGEFRRRGVAGVMCRHSIERARERGFRAIQFNFVVSSNERAVALWQRHGFRIVGRLPDAFKHPSLGFVDAYVMYRTVWPERSGRSSQTTDASVQCGTWRGTARKRASTAPALEVSVP